MKVFCIIMFILLSACFPLTSNSVKSINVNDTKEKVIDKLGKPFSKKAYYNKEYLVYVQDIDSKDYWIVGIEKYEAHE